MASASGAMAKHEQILVLDPPSDLKFKGRLAGTLRSGAEAGAGAGGRRRGGRAVLPSPTPRPSVGAAAPLRPSAPRLAVRRCRAGPGRAGLRCGGEGREPPGAAEGSAAILRPRGAPWEPARALPAGPHGVLAPGAAAARRGAVGRCGRATGSRSSLVGGRQWAPFGGFGQARSAAGEEAFTVAASPGVFPGQVRDSG